MSANATIDTMFKHFQKSLVEEHETRDNIKKICNEIDEVTRQCMSVLQIIHQSDEGIPEACELSLKLFEQIKAAYKRLAEVVPVTEYYRYHEQWRMVSQRCAFLAALVHWLKRGDLATHQDVADMLGVNTEPLQEGFHLDIQEYLIGILMLCSELSRLAVNAVTRQNYGRPMQISRFVMQVNAGFRLLNLKNDFLRKRFDALKYDLKKIEEVVYDLSVRGLLPKEEVASRPPVEGADA